MGIYRRGKTDWAHIIGFFLIGLWLFLGLLTPPALAVVESIEVQGNRRIETSTVLAYLPIRIGQDYDQAQINKALKTLFKTGLFSDITIERKGDVLIVLVKENPIINIVAFEGNDQIEEDSLTPLINLPSRSVYNRAKILQAAQTIKQQYLRQGYYRVQVAPQIIELDQYRVNIVFKIIEGSKNYIEKIFFLGNKVFSDGELRAAIVTTQSSWWKFLSITDTYDPDRLEFDRQLLRAFYTRRGYADFSVEAQLAERSPTSDGFFLTFVVNEGRFYRFGDSFFEIKIPGLDKSFFEDLILYQRGARFDGYKVGRSLDAINKRAQELGYAFIQVAPDLRYDRSNGVINVAWRIAEAPRSYIERINIQGNSHTEDRVIRREIRFDEGDVYNRTLIAQSERHIRSLGFFDGVQVKTSQGSRKDKVVLDVNVAERPTGEISLGFGYSSLDGLIADFSIRESNFQGKGQRLEAGVSYATKRHGVNLTFAEPYFFSLPLRLSASLFYSFDDFTENQGYELTRLGASTSVRFRVRDDAYFTLIYQLISSERIYEGAAQSSLAGEFLESIWGYRLTYDRRDDVRLPSEGWLSQIGQDISGLGGEARYVRSFIDLRFYNTLSDTPAGKYIFATRFLSGHILPWGGYDASTRHNFFLGGGNNLRGFDNAGAGPRSVGGLSLGARYYGALSNEIRISTQTLRQIGLTPTLFLDMAMIGTSGVDLGNDDRDRPGLRMSAGFSLLWDSPLGPLRFDFSDILLKENYDIEENFQFQIGVAF